MYSSGSTKGLGINDLLQLQSLLSYEQEERTKHIQECQNSPSVVHLHSIYRAENPAEISATALAERERLGQAISNLRALKDEYRRERTRQIQTYLEAYRNQALIRSALQEEEERYYRQSIAAAIEQRRAAEAWNRYLDVQKETDYSEYRSNQLAEVLKQLFGGDEQKAKQEEEKEDDDMMAEVWRCMSEQESQMDPPTLPETKDERRNGPKALPPLSDHVITLQDLIQQLASQPVEQQYTQQDPRIYSDEPKPSGIWEKNQPPKKLKLPKVEGKKKAFLPEHVFTEAEPTPTKEYMTDSPLTEESKNFIDKIAAEQKHENEDPKKLKTIETLEEVAKHLSQSELVSRWKRVLSQPLAFTEQDGTLLLMANTDNNRDFLGLEDELVRLMLKLDTVESLGDESVRNDRRELVRKCQDSLDQLDTHKQNELQNAVYYNKQNNS